MIITELLAVLAIAAATGLRIALPLLLIGLISGDQLWGNVPLLSQLPPVLVVIVLVAWSVAELVLSKSETVQHVFQSIELALSPLVGAIAGIAIARTVSLEGWMFVLLGLISALLALVIQLLQVGWFFRPKRPPLWVFFGLDALCIVLVFLAFDAPQQGGLIALLLLWLVIRTSWQWQQWRVVGKSNRRSKEKYRDFMPPD